MKIYVDKMPKATGQGVENQEELEIRMIFDGNKTADIELIHDHDKELVEKVLKKAKSLITKYDLLKDYNSCAGYFMFDKIIDQIQKEYEK